MGYSTDFTGELKFTKEPTVPMLAALKAVFGEDSKILGLPRQQGGYIDLELSNDLTGIKWDGAEKTYNLEHIVTALVQYMRNLFPEFGLTGELLAQGEDTDDRWRLVMEGDVAVKHKIEPAGTKVECPHCRHQFRVG